jgi:predicted GIY-YIG superfamily endonuclease
VEALPSTDDPSIPSIPRWPQFSGVIQMNHPTFPQVKGIVPATCTGLSNLVHYYQEGCALLDRRRTVVTASQPPVGVIYLIHFDAPYRHARHYLGWSEDLNARLAQHRLGRGARLMTVIKDAHINWSVVRTWEGTRALERQLKARHASPRLCPRCRCSWGRHGSTVARHHELRCLTWHDWRMGLTNEELCRRYLLGEPVDQLAAAAEMTRSGLYYRLRRLGVRPRRASTVLPDDLSLAAALERHGSVNAAATALGLPRARLGAEAVRLGLRARPASIPADVAAVYERAGSVDRVAAHYGTTPTTAARWLRSAGVALRPGRRPRDG